VAFISPISRSWPIRENNWLEYAIVVHYLVQQAKKRKNYGRPNNLIDKNAKIKGRENWGILQY